jgi:hypothetical protein
VSTSYVATVKVNGPKKCGSACTSNVFLFDAPLFVCAVVRLSVRTASPANFSVYRDLSHDQDPQPKHMRFQAVSSGRAALG